MGGDTARSMKELARNLEQRVFFVLHDCLLTDLWLIAVLHLFNALSCVTLLLHSMMR
jgi:hypothetical protein